MPRSLRYKVIRFRLFCCVNCGKPRKASPYLRLCQNCGDDKKRKRRKKMGSKAWRKGAPGRPPLKASHNEKQENL
jgi:hypothetical protein